MKYKAFSGITPYELANKVEQALSDKWDLWGGVSVSSDGQMIIFCQAMTKSEIVVTDDLFMSNVLPAEERDEHATHDDIPSYLGDSHHDYDLATTDAGAES